MINLYDDLIREKTVSIDYNFVYDLFFSRGEDDYSIIDIFPHLIEDSNKFDQINIFFQKAREQKKDASRFDRYENCFVSLIEKLWTYNPTFASVNLFTNIKKSYPAQKSKKEIRAFRSVSENCFQLFRVDSLPLLHSITKIGTREIGDVFFLFCNARATIRLTGLNGCVWVDSSPEEVTFLINHSGLFLR